MTQILNLYHCPTCAHYWERVAPSQTNDKCGCCGRLACPPHMTRLISQLVYTWRCPVCDVRWEGERRDCGCGTVQERIELCRLRLEAWEGSARIVSDSPVPPARFEED